MAYNFVTPERDQLYLLPPSLSEWLEEDHLAWFVLECACHQDVGFRVICAGLFPDHTMIARVRPHHEGALKSIFTASLWLCATAGMTSVGIVALDGTKMAANAAEDARFGDVRGDEPPAVLRGRTDRSAGSRRPRSSSTKSSKRSRLPTRLIWPSGPPRKRSVARNCGAASPRHRRPIPRIR